MPKNRRFAYQKSQNEISFQCKTGRQFGRGKAVCD